MNYRLERYLDDEHLETRQYASLQELITNELENLDFSDLIHVSDEDVEQYRWHEPEETAPVPQREPFPYSVGDTVYLENGKPYIIESIGVFDITLSDPTLFYPISRAESRESFARLMERYPQPGKEPAYTEETVAVYPGDKNNLPYDVEIRTLRFDEPEPPSFEEVVDANPISVQAGGEWQTFPNREAAEKAMYEEYKDKLQKLHDAARKDDVVTFEQLGVDRLYVDEAHSFKNLFLYTKMRNVAGLSTTDAQKSSDMLLKCRYIDELTHGKGVTFATGTPISNSMTELYTMMDSDRSVQFVVSSHPGLTDLFLTQARHEQRLRQPLTADEIKAEAARLLGKLQEPVQPNSPGGTHFMAEVSRDFMERAGAKDTAALQKLLPFSTLALTTLKDRRGVFALIGKDEDRSQSLRRPSVRSKLQQASAEQKQPAAKKKDFEL